MLSSSCSQNPLHSLLATLARSLAATGFVVRPLPGCVFAAFRGGGSCSSRRRRRRRARTVVVVVVQVDQVYEARLRLMSRATHREEELCEGDIRGSFAERA